MTLPAPSTQQGEAQILVAVRSALLGAGLENYLDDQVTGMAAAGVTVTLPLPRVVAIGVWDAWESATDGPPALLISMARPTVWVPDVAGQTYHCESEVMVGILLAEADVAGTSPGDVYLASIAYSQAVAYYLQTWLSDSTLGGLVGIYECVITQTTAEPAPVADAQSANYRLSETRHLVRWQAYQEPPKQP